MRTPSPRELLDAWDDGSALPGPERPTPLLCCATGLGRAQVAALPVGEWNRLIVEVRQRVFGDILRTVVECPGCGLALEVALSASTLLAVPPTTQDVEAFQGGYHVRCREPRARDLVEAAATGSAAGARTLLFSRSVVWAERDGVAVEDPAELPDAIVTAAADALARANPLLDVELPLTCEECGSAWSLPFDIGAYLWHELDGWAVRLLDDVHALASAYGWREADVLELSKTRRRHYLELVGHG